MTMARRDDAKKETDQNYGDQSDLHQPVVSARPQKVVAGFKGF